jgi:hypothetical protein
MGMTKKLSWVAAIAAAAVASLALAAATAGATTTPTSVAVAGTQTVVDEAAGTAAMHGSLVGTWQTTKFVPRYQSASEFAATGKELFTGCLDTNQNGACDAREPAGSLKFTFMYWASFDPSSGALLHGSCVHPVTGGSGSFRGAHGILHMEDTPTGADVVTTYKGTIDYQARASGQATRHRSLASASAVAAAPRRGGACGS